MKWSRPRGHYLLNHSQLVTSDLDEARECVGRMWERHRSVLKRGRRYGLRWHQVSLVNSTLSYLCTPSSLDIDCGPVSDSFRITLHEAGRLSHRIDGQGVVSTPTKAVIHTPGQELSLETEPFSVLLLTFEGAYVRSALQQRFEKARLSEDWPRQFSLATPSGAAFRSLVRWTARELDRPRAEILHSDRAAGSLERTLLMLFLDSIAEQNPLGERKGEDLNERRVRQIEEWIDRHYAEPIGIEDLARHAQVSARSVQTAFRRLRGCTPMQRVVRQRLWAAHTILRHATPDTKVTTVATDCGFFDFGRFSRQYREMFGETPSQTLSRVARRTTDRGDAEKTKDRVLAFEA